MFKRIVFKKSRRDNIGFGFLISASYLTIHLYKVGFVWVILEKWQAEYDD